MELPHGTTRKQALSDLVSYFSQVQPFVTVCQPRHYFSRSALTVCGVTVLVLLSISLINSCKVLCYTEPETTDPLSPKNDLEQGFWVAVDNAAEISRQALLQRRRIWPFGKSRPTKAAIEEELAREAIDARETAYKKEKTAQERVRAVLGRREIKHKKLLKGLQESGWHISFKDKAIVGTLQAACNGLRTYFKSSEYTQSRSGREKSSNGRGIAMSAGGLQNLANAYVTLYMLKAVHHSALPVEIFFNGVDEFDRQSQHFFEVNFPGLSLIDISQRSLPPHMASIRHSKEIPKQRGGWMTKAQILYLTSFKEVLVLDCDNIPLSDPAFLFETEEYQASGSLFWPDFWSNNFHNPGPAYSLLGLSNPWMADTTISTTESGQFLIDRQRHDDVLEWIVLLNLHGEEVYDMVWGDKDTYRLAFHLANKAAAFTQVKHRPANALHAPDRELAPAKLQLKASAKSQDEPVKIIAELAEELPKLYKHAGMVQMGPDGSMLFLHRTSDAKLNPELEYPPTYEAVQFITPPLSPRQAAQVHISGQMDLLKFSPDATETCQAARGLLISQAAQECGLIDTISAETMPGDVSKFFPIPLFGIDEFPTLSSQLEKGMDAFRYVQLLFLSGQLRLGEQPPSQAPPPPITQDFETT